MAARRTKGTIWPTQEFDEEKGATILYKATKGLGTDEKAIIDVLSMYSNSQLQTVIQRYNAKYNQDCLEDLKSDLSGCFETAVINRLCPSRLFHARTLRKAMANAGTDESAMIDILCSATNSEITEINTAYLEEFGTTLEDDIVSECSGPLKCIFVSQVQASRDESADVDMDVVCQDVQELMSAGEGQMGTDESAFNKILATRSFQHLQAVFEKYKELAGKTMEETIESELSGDVRKAYLSIVKFSQNPINFYAEQFHDAMAGVSTDEDSLTRLVVSHCEIDMVDVKEAFLSLYGRSLDKWIKADTSGDYCDLLLRLVNGFAME